MRQLQRMLQWRWQSNLRLFSHLFFRCPRKRKPYAKNVHIVDTKHVSVGQCAVVVAVKEWLEAHPEATLDEAVAAAVAPVLLQEFAVRHNLKKITWIKTGCVITCHGGPGAFGIVGAVNTSKTA